MKLSFIKKFLTALFTGLQTAMQYSRSRTCKLANMKFLDDVKAIFLCVTKQCSLVQQSDSHKTFPQMRPGIHLPYILPPHVTMGNQVIFCTYIGKEQVRKLITVSLILMNFQAVKSRYIVAFAEEFSYTLYFSTKHFINFIQNRTIMI